MRPRLRRLLIAVVLAALAIGIAYEGTTRVGRGWLFNEPFYDGRPASFWANEIACWETKDEDWRSFRRYARTTSLPPWVLERMPETPWPVLLDGDPDGRDVLNWLSKHPTDDIRDWARIGLERLDNAERGPIKLAKHDVVFSAQLYEVDEETYKRVKNDWLSSAQWQEIERKWLRGVETKSAGESTFDMLKSQTPLVSVSDRKIKDTQEGLLLSTTKITKCLPTPTQVRQGKSDPQLIEEGLWLSVHAGLSGDRRYLRLRFTEKIAELEGIDRVDMLVTNNGGTAPAELASVKVATFSVTRNLPDGGTMLLPLQYRPADAMQKGRWYIARIQARIHMEEEERLIEAGK